MLIGSRLQQLSVICTLAAVIATPTAIAAATAKPGAIYVNVITKRGKPDFKSTGYQICATKTAKASKAALRQCAAVRSGQAALTIPAGVWYLHSMGGTGQGPCYNRLNNGAYHAACSPVAVKAGRTTTVHWFVPRAR